MTGRRPDPAAVIGRRQGAANPIDHQGAATLFDRRRGLALAVIHR